MIKSEATPANTAFQYVGLIYPYENWNFAVRAASDLGMRKALKIDSRGVSLITVKPPFLKQKKWKLDDLEDALGEYQSERFSHFYQNGLAIGAFLCLNEQENFLRKSIELKVLPENTEIRYL
ncbi:hypothetical protein ISS07_00895 [Candidatus Woesearchaeota archaeon]|nr:hypothetical protein [Candidatus Woesearchaeota archaeon]